MKKEKLAEVPWRNFERAAFENWREPSPPPLSLNPPSMRDTMRVHGTASLPNNDAVEEKEAGGGKNK